MAVNIINSGRARVVINVNDDSFVNLIGEVGTTITSAFLTETVNIVQKLGNTAERTQGYIEENSIENWVGRLTNDAFVQGSGGTTYANPDAAFQDFLLTGMQHKTIFCMVVIFWLDPPEVLSPIEN